MHCVISAPPTVDVSALAKKLAHGRSIHTDPSKDFCHRYGYQTLYEIPVDLQKQIRRELIRDHVKKLQSSPDAVFDHAVFSWLADWMRWLWSETSTEEWEALLAEAEPAVLLSDPIHHVFIGPAARYDGYRWLDARNAIQIESLLRHLYRNFGCERRVIECSA